MGVEEYLGYGGGTATTMAIVASAVMSDHQKFNSNGNSKGGTGCEAHHCCY